jgi:hypothetical protein
LAEKVTRSMLGPVMVDDDAPALDLCYQIVMEWLRIDGLAERPRIDAFLGDYLRISSCLPLINT